MDLMILFRDWFHQPTLEAEPNLAQALSDLRARLARQFASFSAYEFLPIGFIQVSEAELRTLADERLIRYLMGVSNGWQQQRETFETTLKALNALRSQTGYQALQWYSHVAEGGTLPADGFEGGWWPARAGYPRVGDLATARMVLDQSLALAASPAWMPVINLSFEPNGVTYEPNDPVTFALLTMARTHLVVVAAGNRGPDPQSMNPWAIAETVLSVGATFDEAGHQLATYSSRGSLNGQIRGPDLVAWGRAPTGDQGTSFAAPRVAMMGVFCAALLGQVQHAWHRAQGRDSFGVPLMGWGLIDELGKSPELPERLNANALPILGIRLDNMLPALRATDVRIALDPALLKRLLLDAARPMAGQEPKPYEVRAGFISPELLLEYLSRVTVGEVVGWFNPRAQLSSTIGGRPAFAKDELEALFQVVRRTAPAWFWDYDARSFMVNGRIIPDSAADFDFDAVRRGMAAQKILSAAHGWNVADTGGQV